MASYQLFLTEDFPVVLLFRYDSISVWGKRNRVKNKNTLHQDTIFNF
ncbi:MAG: hypothetical protein WAO75_03915 [Atribacterales bacterium]